MARPPAPVHLSCKSMLLALITAAAAYGPLAAAEVQSRTASARFTNLAYVHPRGPIIVLRLSAPEADRAQCSVNGWLPQTVRVRDGRAEYRVHTMRLRSGDYTVEARLWQGGQQVGRIQMPLTIAPPRDLERLPVWNWLGIGGAREGDFVEDSRLRQRCGFTGGLIGWRMDPTVPPTGRTEDMRLLDQAARLGFDGGFALDPYRSKQLQARPELRGQFKDGSPGNGAYPRAPGTLDFARQMAESWVKPLAEFPALRYLFLSTEIEPPLAPHPEAVRLAQAEIGLDLLQLPIVPDKVQGLEGEGTHGRLEIDPKAFPDGIVPDDHPHLRFLKWWWEGGQGTAAMNSAMAETARRIRPDLISFHDPYRLAPVRHSHRGMDMISTWTYGIPDIKRLAYTTYLQAAARADNLRVNQTITFLICDFEWLVTRPDVQPDFTYDNFSGDRGWFSMGPDYAREATWLVLSQRPDVLSYYEAGLNEFTNPRLDPNANLPATLGAIAEVSRTLVQPYGPALLDSQRSSARTAVLASAVGTWFERCPNLGWANEQTLPYAGLLMMNHVPFEVLLDDDLIEGAARRYDTLVLPFSPYITQAMADRLREFMASGGRVIVNEPFRAQLPGVVRTRYDFSFEYHTRGNTPAPQLVTADEHRRRLEDYATDLARHLQNCQGPVHIGGPLQSGQRVLTNSLEAGDVRYHFLINDDRTYGPHFGKHQVRFELGVPQMAEVAIADPTRPALYDAIRRKPLATKRASDGAHAFAIGLPAAGGKLIAALPEPIEALKLDLPTRGVLGQPVTLRVSVLGKSGKAIRGSLPLRVDVDDAWGARTEWSRFSTTRRARDGVCEFVFVPALNDLPGTWTLQVTDLIADRRAKATIEIAAATPAR